MNSSEIKALVTLGAIFALRMLGLFMIVPVFSLAGFDYSGATPFLVGLAVGIYGLTQAIFQIPFSMLADRVPRKKVLCAGLLMFALGGAISALSTSIYGVIFGRALAGSGAVSAVVMALIADLTREQKRSQAMAVIGMVVAGSIMLAFGLGPALYELLGMQGLFWLSSASGVLALGLVWASPTPKRMVRYHIGRPLEELRRLVRASNFYPLYSASFVLHLLMTALFVVLPPILVNQLGISAERHGWLYLPLLLLGFALAVPLIIRAEKQRRMSSVMRFGMLLLALSFVPLLLGYSLWVFILMLAVFFTGFNLLEATLPSWMTKAARVTEKSSVLGLSASAQFLGAFVGGALGGLLIDESLGVVAAVLLGVALLGLVASRWIQEPPYLTTSVVSLAGLELPEARCSEALNIAAVGEVVYLEAEQQALLKIDKNQLSEDERRKLSRLFDQALDL